MGRCDTALKGTYIHVLVYIMHHEISIQDRMVQSDLSELTTTLESFSPFKGLEIEYLQQNYYKTHFNYLVSYLHTYYCM